MRLPWLSSVVCCVLVACPPPPAVSSAEDGGATADDAGTSGLSSDAGGAPLPDGGVSPHAPLPPEAALRSGHFATARVCADCHDAVPTATANHDEQGRPVGLYEQWSASTMGNAARDPLFRAAVAKELARAPAAADAIASVCLTCHAGAGRAALLDGGQAPTFALLAATTPEGTLARDGVTCTVCHQILPDNLGQDSSLSGGYQLGATKQLFGPYAAPFAMPMVNRTGFTPTEGAHVQSSALCGTCHALVTEALTPDGVGTGHRMGEQLTWLEWRRSAYSTEGGATPASCQSCHLPDTRDDGAPLQTRLAHRPDGSDFPQVTARGPFSRHTFVGANTVLPRLLRDGRALLSPPASDASLLAAEDRAKELLRRATAAVSVADARFEQGRARFSVRVENRTGHKFPTGYPSRRTFLHVRVLDASGALLAEVGASDLTGRLLGADGRPLAEELPGGGAYPHRREVSSSAEPAVWESVMSDGHGQPSYELLGAEGFLKDDRLLPRGHADTSVGPTSTSPLGVEGDTDFIAGGDTVAFSLAVSGTPARVEVELRYQTMSPRYLEELLAHPTPEAATLRSMVREGTFTAELVATGSVDFP